MSPLTDYSIQCTHPEIMYTQAMQKEVTWLYLYIFACILYVTVQLKIIDLRASVGCERG